MVTGAACQKSVDPPGERHLRHLLAARVVTSQHLMRIDSTATSRLSTALERHARLNMKWGRAIIREIEPNDIQRFDVWTAELDTLVEERYVRHIRRTAERAASRVARGWAQRSMFGPRPSMCPPASKS
jgi:hypothetical protein